MKYFSAIEKIKINNNDGSFFHILMDIKNPKILFVLVRKVKFYDYRAFLQDVTIFIS